MKKFEYRMTITGQKTKREEIEAESLRAAWKVAAGVADALCKSGRVVMSLAVEKI